MRIIILSRSGELYSTRSLFRAARIRNHFVRVVDHVLCDMVISNNTVEMYYNGEEIKGYDAIIPRIGHTVTAVGVNVIRQFENMGVFSTLNSHALINARNKLSCLQMLSSRGIKIPKTVFANNQYFLSQMADNIPEYPKIIKLLSGTHGLGVLKSDDPKNLEAILEAFMGLRQKALIQEFIKESSGVDIRAFVVDGEVVACMKRSAQKGEFRSNLHRGATAKAIILTPEETETAINSAEVMGLGVAGVDMLRSDRGPLVLEVNASPGLEGIENVTRVNVAKKIIQFIEKNGKRR